jgi:hypothetical protein
MEENKIIIYHTDDGKNSVKLFAKKRNGLAQPKING